MELMTEFVLPTVMKTNTNIGHDYTYAPYWREFRAHVVDRIRNGEFTWMSPAIESILAHEYSAMYIKESILTGYVVFRTKEMMDKFLLGWDL